jgi:acetyl-CoA carboxylase carboxyltransferase component
MSSDFPVIPTTIESSSEQFIKCREKWRDVLAKYEEAVRWCVSEGQDKYVNRHIERIKMLLDPDAPFLELCIFAGYQQSGSSPCASIVAGIGVVRCSPTIYNY